MKTYIINFIDESGSKDYRCVDAATPEEAVNVFRNAGRSWLGVDFATVAITSVVDFATVSITAGTER